MLVGLYVFRVFDGVIVENFIFMREISKLEGSDAVYAKEPWGFYKHESWGFLSSMANYI